MVTLENIQGKEKEGNLPLVPGNVNKDTKVESMGVNKIRIEKVKIPLLSRNGFKT